MKMLDKLMKIRVKNRKIYKNNFLFAIIKSKKDLGLIYNLKKY